MTLVSSPAEVIPLLSGAPAHAQKSSSRRTRPAVLGAAVPAAGVVVPAAAGLTTPLAVVAAATPSQYLGK